MKSPGPLWLVLALFIVSISASRNQQSTTPRTQAPNGESIKQLTNQLMGGGNSTSDITLDTRTPPRVKLHMKRTEDIENSHPGIAEPIDEESIVLEETMKKLNFYKIEKPTTDSGLSTWILLSGQSTISPLTTKSPKVPVNKQSNNDQKNVTIIPNSNRPGKPIFKKRPIPSTTKPPATTTIGPQKTTKLMKIKASILSNAIINKTASNATKSNNNTIVSKKDENKIIKTKHSELNKNSLRIIETINSSELVPELKTGDLELATSTTQTPKKSRRPTNKKKKDKNRRRKPVAEDKMDSQNKTKLVNKVNQKEKPISTQIYNYLAREVMPTVGVGLVGLMVTAGLASYFLYPFGGLRRSYDIDRKDKDDSYYYGNDFTSGGIAEEEAIGKVIAGMPASTHYKNYRYHNSRNSYPNTRHRQVDQTYYTKPEASVETVQLDPVRDYDKNNIVLRDTHHSKELDRNEPITYNKDVIAQNVDVKYTTNDQKFVVGNVPKEMVLEVTPAVVPEHGPRNLKIRKKRDVVQDDISNEIQVDELPPKMVEETTSVKNEQNIRVTSNNNTTTSRPVTSNNEISEKVASLVQLVKDLLTMKIKMGLELLQNKALQISRYISVIQERLNKS